MAKGSKKITILIIQIALVLFFVIGMTTYMNKELNPVEVYVYTSNINSGSTLTMNDLTLIKIPAEAKGEGFLTQEDVNRIMEENMVVTSDVEAGQYIYSNQIASSDEVDPFETLDLREYRKVTIPISLETAIAGEIKAGDKIDLAFSAEAEVKNRLTGEETSVSYTKSFMQDVLVYSVLTEDGFQYNSYTGISKSEFTAGDGANGEEANPPAYVVVAVPMIQAEEILTRMNTGSITILGRFEDSEYTNSDGFVMGSDFTGSIFAGEKSVEASY
jgi:Flp pilus assembly protein CpaB